MKHVVYAHAQQLFSSLGQLVDAMRPLRTLNELKQTFGC